MDKKNENAIAICLNCYKIRFKQKNQQNSKNIEEVFKKNDFIEIIKDFIKNIDSSNVFKNKKEDRILYIKETLKVTKSENYYAGIIMKGHNGTQTSIDELVKGEVKNIGTVSKDQFNSLPYFFLLYLNKSKPDHIIFIAQSYKQFGFKEVFEEAFRSYTYSKSDDSSVFFNTLTIASLFEKYIQEGFINKMRFVKYGLLKGAENVIKDDNQEEKNYEMEMSIKSKKGFLGIKKELKYEDASFIEQLQIDGFEFDEVFADVIVAGRKRVLNVSKPKEFSAAYDITNEVRINKNTNLPNFNDILKQAIEILNNDLIPYI